MASRALVSAPLAKPIGVLRRNPAMLAPLVSASYDDPIRATAAALLQRLTGTQPSLLADGDRLDGVALVTGANRGLGQGIAVELAKRGAEVILAGRSAATNTRRAIRQLGGEARCEHVDLSDLRSIEALCDRLEGTRLTALILNAGVVPSASRATAQDFEIQNGVNYLANVALTDGLLARGCLEKGARVVAVSSESHRSAERIELDRLGEADSYGIGGVMPRYGYSKLLLTTWANHMARELAPDVSVCSMCPGPVRTGIAREAPKIGQLLLAPIMRAFFVAPEVGALPVVYLACGEALEGRTGHYFHRWEDKDPAPPALDEDAARALVERSRKLIRERTPST